MYGFWLLLLLTKLYFHTGTFKYFDFFNPLSANTKKWSNTLKQFVGHLLTNRLVVCDHFVGLALKGLTHVRPIFLFYTHRKHSRFSVVFRRYKKGPLIWYGLTVSLLSPFKIFLPLTKSLSLSTLSITLIPSYSPCADYFRMYTLTYEDMTFGMMLRAKSNINALIMVQFREYLGPCQHLRWNFWETAGPCQHLRWSFWETVTCWQSVLWCFYRGIEL